MADVRSLSELTEPLGSLLINDLLEFEVVSVEVEGLGDVVEEVLD
jgi:hypothetical protein